MINLKVRGIDLDLSSNAVIALTKQVADIGQFQNRLSSFTNKFTLPLTANNRALLGIEDIESNSDIPYSLTDCSLWFNGIEVASNSRLVVDEFADNAKVSLRPGNAGFFDIIKTLKLRDFDLSEFDHLWNRGRIIAFKDNDFTDGINYPLIDAGNQSASNQVVRTKGLIPGMFVKYLMNRVADFYGYQINYPTDSLMDELFLLITTQQVGQRISNDVKWVVEKDTQSVIVPASFNNDILLTFDLASSFTDTWNIVSTGIVRIPFRGKYKIRVTADIQLGGADSVSFVVGDTTALTVGQFQTVDGFYEWEGTFSNENYSESETFNQLVRLYIRIVAATGGTVVINNLTFECIDNDLPETNYNRPISIQHNLPDITVGQLFVEFGNITGCLYAVDDIAQTIRVIKLNEIADNKIAPLEYQKKIDVSITPLKRFAVAGYGKTTILRYANVSDNNFSISIDNEQLPDTANLINSLFNSSDLITWSNEPPIGAPSYFSLYDLITLFIPLWDSAVGYLKLDGVNRICRVFPQPDPINLNFWESNFNSGIVSTYNIATFEGLNWETLYNDRFDRVLGGLIDKMQYLEVYFKIDEIDLINFDFAKPIYLEKPNGYYFVRSIVEFTGSQDSTKFILNRI